MSHEQGGDKSREPLTPRVVEQMRAAGKAGYLDTGSAAWDMLCDLALSALRSSVAGSEAAAQAYKDFWDKHAKGSMLCPSCLMCGAACAKEQWAIRHAELPDIYICACCVEKVRNPIETGVSATAGCCSKLAGKAAFTLEQRDMEIADRDFWRARACYFAEEILRCGYVSNEGSKT